MAPEVRWAKTAASPTASRATGTRWASSCTSSAGRCRTRTPRRTPPTGRTTSRTPAEDFVKRLLAGPHQAARLWPVGINEILEHPYWRGIEWDLVPLKKFESPCKGLKGPPKRKKEKENQAVQIANDISEAEREEPDSEYNVSNWDFVSPTAVIEEYMENMYQCVSSI